MVNYFCYVCNEPLTKENETSEHIILNAIGGKLKSKRLICRTCNSKFGSDIDNELAEQLSTFSTLLNVKRDNGKPRNIKGEYKGTEIYIEPSGKMKRAKPKIDIDGDKYQITTSTISEARSVMNGLKRKYPKLDVETEIAKAKVDKVYLPEIKLASTIGGENAFRSICKTAINYYILCEGDSSLIKHLIPYIEGLTSDNKSVYYFYPQSEVFYKGEEEVFHSLILIGEPKNNKLFVYVELFNEIKFVVMLNEYYEGPSIYNSYHYDVVSNKEVNFERKFIITSRDLKRYAKSKPDVDAIIKRVSHLLQRIDKVKVSRRISEITSAAMEVVKSRYPESEYEYFTPEMINLFTNEVVNNFILSFQHRIVDRDDLEEVEF